MVPRRQHRLLLSPQRGASKQPLLPANRPETKSNRVPCSTLPAAESPVEAVPRMERALPLSAYSRDNIQNNAD